MAAVAPEEKVSNGNGPVILTQVKSDLHFDDLMRSDMTPNGGPETPPYDDLATIEKNKKQTEKYAHENESFWSWFCCRCLCCDGYFPCYWPDSFWVGSGDCCSCSCDCCSGCGDCLGGCCEGCGDCAGACCEAGCSGGCDCGSC